MKEFYQSARNHLKFDIIQVCKLEIVPFKFRQNHSILKERVDLKYAIDSCVILFINSYA